MARQALTPAIRSPTRRAIDAVAVVLVLAYVAFAATLAIRQHDSFHTHAFDMAYFDNVMWNTSQGRLFVNDMPDKPRIFLGEHVSPLLIVLAPLYWLWPDARMLLIAQAVALALTTVPAYLLVRRARPLAALLVLAALLLNPALLGVALSEFHEISLAAPLLAWALWAMLRGHTRIMVACLLAALLAKEEVAVVVAAVGAYVFIAWPRASYTRHASWLGAGLAVGALGWLAFVWGVLPALLPEAVSHWRLRYGDIAPTPLQGVMRMLTDPAFLVSRFAVPAKGAAVLRVLAPLGFLPMLSPGLGALALPVVGYLLASSKHSVSELQVWYVAPLLPILYLAAARTIEHARPRLALALSGLCLLAALWGYWQYGEGPLAAQYEPARFAVTERTACGHKLLELVPPTASLSALDNLMPHLAHRSSLWVFPSMGEPLAEYVAIDANYEVAGGYSNWPLVRRLDVPAFVNRFLSDPAYALIGDGCDYKVLQYTATPRIPHALNETFGAQVDLLGFDVAVRDADGIYRPAARTLTAGQAARVTLWWRARAPVMRPYTVFVHALDADGQLAGQHDGPPAGGTRPTTEWVAGDMVRDAHYLSVASDAARVLVGMYDASSGARLKAAGGDDSVTIIPLP